VLPSYFLNVVVSLFSGQRLFEEILYQLFNVVFTASPIIIFGVFEQDITKKDCLEFPQLYKVGPDKVHATRRTFVQWLLTGVWHSICVFFIPYLVMCKTQIIDRDGIPSDIWLFGAYVYLSIVVVVNLKLIMESYYLNAVLMSGIFVSVGLWFFSLYILEIMPQIFSTNGLKPENVNLSPSLAGVSKRLYTSPMTFFVILITCVTALLRDFIFKAFRFRFRARDYHLLMASLSKKGKEARPETKMPRTAISGTKDLAVFTEADPTSTLVLSSPTVKQSGKASRLSGILTPTPFRSRASSLAPVH
jgi:phospholipid-translocating ATPase